MLAYRVMLQDFLALSKLYYVADNCKFDMQETIGFGCDQVADAFAQASFKLQAALIDERRKGDSGPESYERAMKTALAPLSVNARNIYKTWWEHGFLRNAELGFGVMGGSSARCDTGRGGRFVKAPANDPEHSVSPYVNDTGKSFVEGIAIDGGSSWRFTGQTSPSIRSTGSGDVRMFFAERKSCDFDPKRKNYSAFARFYKVLPLLVPTNNGVKFYAFGPGNNFLTFWSDDGGVNHLLSAFPKLNQSYLFSSFGVSDEGAARPMDFGARLMFDGGMTTVYCRAVEFTPNRQEKILENTDKGIKLYPIPFSAAEGVADWRGQAFSTSVRSLSDLRSALERIQSDLKVSNTWSFSSDAWPDGWGVSDYYHDAGIAKQYMGLLEEKDYTAG